jgi:hypothetical protein
MNGSQTLVKSGTYTAAPTIADLIAGKEKGIVLVIDVTSIHGGAPSITVTIKGKDPASGKYYTILASVALNSVATTVLRVYPGLVASANATVNDILPPTWTVTVTHADGQQIDYSIGANLLM